MTETGEITPSAEGTPREVLLAFFTAMHDWERAAGESWRAAERTRQEFDHTI